MPIIETKLVRGVFDETQKEKLIRKITDAVEEIQPGLRDVTFVTIDEVDDGAWGIGGDPITAEKVRAHVRENLSAS